MEYSQLIDELAEMEKWEIYELLEELETELELINAKNEIVAEIEELIWGIEKYLDKFDWRD